ncbi:MAG: PAS domain-containing protein [Comamonadaceae bacterium]|nr:PAS domain-containing protein [Comamonadaceae bacterium]
MLEELTGRGAWQGETRYRTRLRLRVPGRHGAAAGRAGRARVHLPAGARHHRPQAHRAAAGRCRLALPHHLRGKPGRQAAARAGTSAIAQANIAAGKLLGYAPGELVGRTPAAILQPGDADAMERLQRRLAAGAAVGRRHRPPAAPQEGPPRVGSADAACLERRRGAARTAATPRPARAQLPAGAGRHHRAQDLRGAAAGAADRPADAAGDDDGRRGAGARTAASCSPTASSRALFGYERRRSGRHVAVGAGARPGATGCRRRSPACRRCARARPPAPRWCCSGATASRCGAWCRRGRWPPRRRASEPRHAEAIYTFQDVSEMKRQREALGPLAARTERGARHHRGRRAAPGRTTAWSAATRRARCCSPVPAPARGAAGTRTEPSG